MNTNVKSQKRFISKDQRHIYRLTQPPFLFVCFFGTPLPQLHKRFLTLNPPACRAVRARAAFFLLPESSDPQFLSLLSPLLLLLLLLMSVMLESWLLLLQSSSRTMVSGSVPGEFLAFFPEFEAVEVDALLLRVIRSQLIVSRFRDYL